jgi:hypothetical protein
MKKNKFVLFALLLIIAGTAFSPVALATGGEVTEIERHVPSDLSSGETTEIVLEITGDTPFIAGIVETIPEGFKFPADDADVSDASHFKVDRDAGKIAFSVDGEDQITYNVIPSGNDGSGFEGYWVDLLFQTQELNEGKERWTLITDPNSTSTTMSSSSGTGDAGETAKSPGFEALPASIAILSCMCIFRKYRQGGDEK